MDKRRGFTPLEISRNGESGQVEEWAGGEVGKKHTFSLSHFLICKGLTLIEILVALAILGMIALALYNLLKGGLDVWRGGKERTDIIAQARVAMDRLTREVREATYMVVADATSIRFSAWLGSTTELSDISYYWNDLQDTLYRNVSAGGTVQTGAQKEMAYSVTTFDFDYYSKWADNTINLFNPGAGSYNSIWMIAIDAQVTRGLTGEENVVNLRSTIQPRNYSYPQ